MNVQPLLSPQDLFGSLPVHRTSYLIHYHGGRRPQGFTGSAWRGILGPGLRDILCPFPGNKLCRGGCHLQEACPYFMLFRKQSTLPGKSDAPKGYLLFSRPMDRADRELLELTLFGDCHKHEQAIFDILQRCGRQGKKLAGKRFEILENETLAPATSRSPAPHLLRHWINAKDKTKDRRFFFPYPVRLVKKENKKKKVLNTMNWSFFFLSVARKLEDLNILYNQGKPLGKEKAKQLETMFQGWSNITDTLQWRDLKRYSSTQGKKVPLGGLTGKVLVSRCTPLQHAWFQAASLVGAGKARVMGLGKIMELTEQQTWPHQLTQVSINNENK